MPPEWLAGDTAHCMHAYSFTRSWMNVPRHSKDSDKESLVLAKEQLGNTDGKCTDMIRELPRRTEQTDLD